MNIRKRYNVKLNLVNYLNPDCIYIPINDNLLVKENDNVYKYSLVTSNNISSISGICKSITNKYINNINKDCILVENDFKDSIKGKNGIKRNIDNIDKEILKNKLKEFYNINLDNIKTLLVNGIDKDPYEFNNSYIINNYIEKVLETIDYLINIFKFDKTYIVIDSNDNNNVYSVNSNIGTYPNITLKVIKNEYPYAFNELIGKRVLEKSEEDNTLILSVEQIYSIYNLIKRDKVCTEKYITVSFNDIDEVYIYNIKLGTCIKDLIKQLDIDRKYEYIVKNGLIGGIEVSNDELIDLNTRSIFLCNKLKDEKLRCINCGLCNIKCPVGLNPKHALMGRKIDNSKCIHCGLCSYICPARINFKGVLNKNE